MSVRQAEEGEIDFHTVDRYTFAHMGVGALMGLARAPWWLAVGSAVLWEFVENPLKDAYPEAFHQRTKDTMGNSVVDAAAWVLGWGVMYRLTDRYPLLPAKGKTE